MRDAGALAFRTLGSSRVRSRPQKWVALLSIFASLNLGKLRRYFHTSRNDAGASEFSPHVLITLVHKAHAFAGTL